MKTISYNPSPLEVAFAQAFEELKDEIDKKLEANQIVKIENDTSQDNPSVTFHLVDEDGDKHVVIAKLIQKIDMG